jgi:two-component system sensor histidine kinase/response regulator
MATHLNLNRQQSSWLPNAQPENELPPWRNLPWAGTNGGLVPEDREHRKPATAAASAEITIRILVVDNHKVNLQKIGAMLGAPGIEIVPARSGAQALKRMAARRPALVVIGGLGPDFDGFELCRLITANPEWAGIPVLIYSRAGDKGVAARAFASGAADCMDGAMDESEVISRVGVQLSRKAARDSSRQLTEEREESLGILMHDLQNHLVGMNMSADVLGDGNGPVVGPRARLMLGKISSSSSHMLSFVNRFLENASAEHQLIVKLEPVCFSEAASRSVRQFQEAARRKRLVVLASLPVEGTLVHADPNALNQVLDNILSNAVKFSPPGKQISVVVRPAPGYVECHVQDQGSGFTQDDKTRMFRRYQRLSARPTGGETSIGLGLSIVKKLVDAMCGDLVCESSAGSGARFSIRLPRAVA